MDDSSRNRGEEEVGEKSILKSPIRMRLAMIEGLRLERTEERMEMSLEDEGGR